ncbi:MAG: hypothetical protein ABEJ46_04415, partial [Gemmatimonadota bacterium]
PMSERSQDPSGERRAGRPRTGGRRPGGGRAGVAVVVAGLLALTGLAGCASAGGTTLSNTMLDSQDLADVSDQFETVYDFLKAHSQATISTFGGQTHEILTVYGRGRRSLTMPMSAGALLYVNDDRVPNAVPYLKDLRMSEVERLLILRPSEASSRFGGDGRRGAVAIWTKSG